MNYFYLLIAILVVTIGQPHAAEPETSPLTRVEKMDFIYEMTQLEQTIECPIIDRDKFQKFITTHKVNSQRLFFEMIHAARNSKSKHELRQKIILFFSERFKESLDNATRRLDYLLQSDGCQCLPLILDGPDRACTPPILSS